MSKWIVDITKKVHEAIKVHAEEKGISYEEAAKKAYLSINGVEISPLEISEIKNNGLLQSDAVQKKN